MTGTTPRVEREAERTDEKTLAFADLLHYNMSRCPRFPHRRHHRGRQPDGGLLWQLTTQFLAS
jgi:hypothetical protein